MKGFDKLDLFYIISISHMFNLCLSGYTSSILYIVNLHLTINSTRDVTVHSGVLLTTSVKFLVSVHLAFSIIKFVVFTVVSDTNSCDPSNQETLDKGLLEICRVNTTLSVSLAIITAFSSIDGLSVIKMKLIKYILKV